MRLRIGLARYTKTHPTRRAARTITVHHLVPPGSGRMRYGGPDSGPHSATRPTGFDATDGGVRPRHDQVKRLTPPGPTSRPTMIRTMPQRIWARSRATMPATTSTTARIHNRV